MSRTRMFAGLLVFALGAIAFQALFAQEPAASTPPAPAPPATSIREWLAPPSATPAADLVAAPAGPTTPATSIREWLSPSPSPTAPTQAAGATPGPTVPARSIREWMTTPSATPGPCPTATPIASLAAAPAANPSAKPGAPTSPVTISFKSTMRAGNLVVFLDDVPVFNEKFQKPLLIISQTTTWDPLQVASGPHRLSAKVYGAKKTYFSKTYDLQLSRTKGAALRFVMQGDKLTVALAS